MWPTLVTPGQCSSVKGKPFHCQTTTSQRIHKSVAESKVCKRSLMSCMSLVPADSTREKPSGQAELNAQTSASFRRSLLILAFLLENNSQWQVQTLVENGLSHKTARKCKFRRSTSAQFQTAPLDSALFSAAFTKSLLSEYGEASLGPACKFLLCTSVAVNVHMSGRPLFRMLALP